MPGSSDEKTKIPRFWYNYELAHFGQNDKCRGLAALDVVNVDRCLYNMDGTLYFAMAFQFFARK